MRGGEGCVGLQGGRGRGFFIQDDVKTECFARRSVGEACPCVGSAG